LGKKYFLTGLFFLPALVLFSGCAALMPESGAAKVDYINDDNSGVQIWTLINNELSNDEYNVSTSDFRLGVEKYARAKEDARYFLKLEYKGKEWLLISGKESLVLYIDADRFVYKDCSEERQSGEYDVHETLLYEIDDKIILKLAGAGRIKAVITGEKGSVTVYFSRRNIMNIKEFYDEIVMAVKEPF